MGKPNYSFAKRQKELAKKKKKEEKRQRKLDAKLAAEAENDASEATGDHEEDPVEIDTDDEAPLDKTDSQD